jgi:hypothetical protein
VNIEKLTLRGHAIRRMFERRVSTEDVRAVLTHGERIEDYPEDKPFPSYLILSWVKNRPLHVVAADNIEDRETFVITVYEPDLTEWEPGFKKRKGQS